MTTPVVAETGAQTEQSRRKRKWDSVEEEAASGALDAKESKPDVNAAEALVKEGEGTAKGVDLNAAIEAASRIKATLSAKGVDTSASGCSPAAAPVREASLVETLGIDAEKKTKKEVDVKTQQFHTVVDINDSRHRYVLIKNATQLGIEAQTGTTIVSRGKYIPDRSMATPHSPALSLEVYGTTQADVDAAVQKIHEIMEKGVVGEARRPFVTSFPFTAKTFLPFEPDFARMASYNIRGKMIGPQASYLKHIQAVSGADVSIRGRGSGHIEVGASPPSDDPIHLFIQAFSEDEMNLAKQLCEDLLATVHKEYEAEYARVMASLSAYMGVYGAPYASYMPYYPPGTPQPYYGMPAYAGAYPYPQQMFYPQAAPIQAGNPAAADDPRPLSSSTDDYTAVPPPPNLNAPLRKK